MLIAFISDIHGNWPALEAAAIDARRRGAERIVCAGDVVGYLPFPNECIRFLQEQQIPAILGNYDLKVLQALRDPKALKRKMKPAKWKILNWTRKRIDEEGARFLAALPERWSETAPSGQSILMTHGSPRSCGDPIYPSVTAAALKRKLQGDRPDVLICGHTHIPFVRRISRMLVINCGAIGYPVDGDPRAAYALVRFEADRPARGRIVRVKYPLDRVMEALSASALPREMLEDMENGQKAGDLV